jgi:hypothetical protein
MPGHPRLVCNEEEKTWMPGTSPGMTANFAARGVLERRGADGKTPLPHRALAIAVEAAGMRRLPENPAKNPSFPCLRRIPRG